MEIIAGLFLFLILLGLRFAIVALIAWGLDWVLESTLNHPVPYWPVFFGCILLSFLVGGSSSKE